METKERQISHDFTDMQNTKKEKTKTHRYREKIGGCQRERGLGEQKAEGDQEPRAQTLSSKINKS